MKKAYIFLQKGLAFVLVVQILALMFICVAGATTTSLAETSSNTKAWKVTSINSYNADSEIYHLNTVSVIYGESAEEKVANGTFPEGADYKYHTAFVIEHIGYQIPDDTNSYEFIVDAVVTGTDTKKDHLKAKTDQGFVIYILNNAINSDPTNIPMRGDLVKTDFWVKSPDTAIGEYKSNGYGTLTFVDNPSAEETVSTVEGVHTNAKVNIYNYDSNINNTDSGFYFWNGDWGYGASYESADGAGVDSDLDKKATRYLIDKELDANGYPTYNGGKSLAYLFDGSSKRNDGSSTLIGSMNDGGGLFREINGYYYYDSLYNAAYYDEANNRFELYENTIVRPWYDTGNTSKSAYGNFLPFNKVTADNILIDGTVTYNDNALATAVTGSQPSSDIHNFTDVSNNENVIQSARLEETVDLGFGITMDLEFIQPEGGKLEDGNDMTFEFLGDDDVLVYLGIWNKETHSYDYKLTLDIGGVHGARSGYINFATGVVKDHPDTLDGTTANSVARETSLKEIFGLESDTFEDLSKLSLKFFYLERGGNISYCGLGFNIPALPQTPLTITKTVQSDVEVFDDIVPYTFRIMEADSQGNATDVPLITNSTYEIIENNLVVGNGTVDENGYFTIKSNQTARFSSMFIKTDDGTIDYVVQELVPENVVEQYESITYNVENSSPISFNANESENGYTIYATQALSGKESQDVEFINKVDDSAVGTLTIDKKGKSGAVIPDDISFNLLVKLNDSPIPVGTQYYIDDDETAVYEVENEGIIPLKLNQKATLVKGLLAGTEFSVEEKSTDTYKPEYSGVIITGDASKDLVGSTTEVSGVMTIGGKAVATVTNDDNSDSFKIIFHTNNDDISYDVFRTYYEHNVVLPEGNNNFELSENGTLDSFYDIPEFEYYTHNNYIFKGWYLDKDNDSRPINWQEQYTQDTDVYARWILVEDVTQDEADSKEYDNNGQYSGYDLLGVQIRNSQNESDDYYGDLDTGLRFVTVLSEDVYTQINALSSENASGAEYGYAIAKTATANSYAGDVQGYEIEYKDTNVNGKDTTTDYKYVSNLKCSGVPDHYNGNNYRLYTAVVTFKNKTGDALQEAHASKLLARSYIRYTDANGLLRTHYNNYTGTNVLSGCSASFDDALSLMNLN